ncbi:unnamed protein product [Caenorhabditis auriculariae]|uniref:Uncharacterized protein n=1 Tax=Caenorhabditis auriculariae TaxID=2777116 RepID=A0A8S1HDG6_9PELO|nr:unnamed protein product [Caenorhabditis auriculariae]
MAHNSSTYCGKSEQSPKQERNPNQGLESSTRQATNSIGLHRIFAWRGSEALPVPLPTEARAEQGPARAALPAFLLLLQ